MMFKYSNSFLALFLFLVALFTRLLWAEVPINTDETLWIDRGALFFVALLKGELEETYLRHHPGVTNMWLIGGAFSLRYLLREIWPLSASLTQFVPESSHLGRVSDFGSASGLVEYLNALASDNVFPVAAYVQVRFVFAFVTAASITGIFLLTRRLLGQRVALIMAALLLLEPFYLAYQRFITTDGNQSNFMWLALLSFLLYLRQSTGRINISACSSDTNSECSNDFRREMANAQISMLEVNSPESRVNAAESTVNSPESRVNSLQNGDNSPESRVNAAESRVNPTQNRVENGGPFLRDTKRRIFDCSPRASARSFQRAKTTEGGAWRTGK